MNLTLLAALCWCYGADIATTNVSGAETGHFLGRVPPQRVGWRLRWTRADIA